MLKAILFDAGGVIITTDSQLDRLAKIFKPKDRDKFRKKINEHHGPLCTGQTTEREYWTKIAESENFDIKKVPENLWSIDYEKITKINKELVSLIKRLREKYKVILISNTMEPHVRINRTRGFFDNFDDVLNSNEVRLSKDTPEIFKLALKRNNLKPEECVFVDDIQKFVDIAVSMGIEGILFKSTNQLKTALRSMGTENV